MNKIENNDTQNPVRYSLQNSNQNHYKPLVSHLKTHTMAPQSSNQIPTKKCIKRETF